MMETKKQLINIYNQGNHTCRRLEAEYGISTPNNREKHSISAMCKLLKVHRS